MIWICSIIMSRRRFLGTKKLPDKRFPHGRKVIENHGTVQKQWFFDTVSASDATFKVLLSPTPIVGPDRLKKNDNHSNKGFTHEGDELRRFIAAQENLYIVCGDRHWQYASIDPKTGAREFSCGPGSDNHSGGYWEQFRNDMHRFLRVKGGFLSVDIDL